MFRSFQRRGPELTQVIEEGDTKGQITCRDAEGNVKRSTRKATPSLDALSVTALSTIQWRSEMNGPHETHG